MSSFDPAVIVSNLADEWFLALWVGGAMFSATLLLVRIASPNVRETITLRLMGVEEERWSDSVCSLFDGFFGRNHLSLRCIFLSVIMSLTTVTALWIVLGGEGTMQTRTEDARPFLQVLVIGLAINVVADYVSLLETRWLLRGMRGWRSVWAQAGVLLADLAITAAIILGAIYAYAASPLNEGGDFSVGELLGVFSIYSIFFYSTFITSVWTWGYILSSWTIRLFARYRLAERFDAQDNLAFVLAAFVGLVIGAGTLVALVPLQKDADGVSRFENTLCNAFGGQTCHAVARLTEDEEAKAQRVLQGCATGASAVCLEKGLSRYEIDPEVVFEHFRAACDGENAAGCTNLGYLYRDGTGVAQDYARAAALFEEGCDGGDAPGCTKLGFLYGTGTGVAQDDARAAELYKEGCDGGHANGCTILGFLYDNGTGVAQDYARAAALYKEGCDGGDALGCTYLGTLYGAGTGVAQDFARAAALYKEGCEGGHWLGCRNLGALYYKGTGVAQDVARAIEIFREDCDGGNAIGCTILGALYYKGTGVARDVSRAVELFEEACDGGDELGCRALEALEQK